MKKRNRTAPEPAEERNGFEIHDGILSGYTGHDCHIAIPDGVTGIDPESPFWDCPMESIHIPKSVTAIGIDLFSGCGNLVSITVEPGNPVYHSEGNCIIETAGKTLIAGCRTSVIPADGSVTRIGAFAFSGCPMLTGITLPEFVTDIYAGAFAGCADLTAFRIPQSVKQIGVNVFSGCTGLTTLTVEPGNPVYHSDGNCLIETASKTLIAGCRTSVIPTDGSVTAIGAVAFSGCEGLTGITIPEGVTNIGAQAFFYCDKLKHIRIPESVKSIGSFAFWGCRSQKILTIPRKTAAKRIFNGWVIRRLFRAVSPKRGRHLIGFL